MLGEAPLPKIMQSSVNCCAIQSSKLKILTVLEEKKQTNKQQQQPTYLNGTKCVTFCFLS